MKGRFVLPKFSVILPVLNEKEYLPKALDALIHQSDENFELVIVDGGSTDGSLKIAAEACEKYAGFYLIKGKFDTAFEAMNRGLKAAEGDYDILYGQTQLVDEAGHVLGGRHLAAPPVLTAASFKQGMVVCHQAFVVRRMIASQYDLNYRFSSDYEWCIRCLRQSRGNGYVGEKPLVNFLVAAGGTTERHRWASLRERFGIMCRYYGFIPTAIRHLLFVPRFLREKRRMKKVIRENTR